MTIRSRNSRRPKLNPLPVIKVVRQVPDSDPNHDVEEIIPSQEIRQRWENHDNKIGPECFGGSDFDDFAPIITPEIEESIKDLYNSHPELRKPAETVKPSIDLTPLYFYTGVDDSRDNFHPDEAWTQTYSGRRFNPVKPIPEAIVIQDVAHALSMQCRFGGHVKNFYSVAQHCVLVSHICDAQDALWGLLHDATEAYLVDVPRPLKRSGQLEGYMKIESVMQTAICQRFGLEDKEPASVKNADTLLLATEARDLLPSLRSDWTQPMDPLPFTIKPLGPREAKHLYLKRFFQLVGSPECFDRYLEWEAADRI